MLPHPVACVVDPKQKGTRFPELTTAIHYSYTAAICNTAMLQCYSVSKFKATTIAFRVERSGL
jgi:hypothetical protein